MRTLSGYSRIYFAKCRSVSAERADFEHLAVVAGFERNPELAAAVVLGHDRHHRDHRFASGIIQRGLHVALLAELDQVARGREWQLEAAALAALQRLARRDPDRVGGLFSIMGTDLFRRCGGEEEPGIEALRAALQ